MTVNTDDPKQAKNEDKKRKKKNTTTIYFPFSSGTSGSRVDLPSLSISRKKWGT